MTRLFSPFLLSTLFMGFALGGTTDQREGLFNTTSYINLLTPITLNKHIGLSFRSCTGGQLFFQRSARYTITLEVRTEGLFFTVTIGTKRFETRISANLLDNEWHTVNILYRMGNLTISTSGHQQTIANLTFNSEILKQPELFSNKDVLVVGRGFEGCILEGPSLVFNGAQLLPHNVEWGSCPLPTTSCGLVDHCAHEPCMMHGRCITLPDRYLCQCTPRYSGNNCHIDNGPPCEHHPCNNGGTCLDDKTGDYSCYCVQGFAGKDCDVKIITEICHNNSPCRNNGTCIPSGGPNTYKCICQAGFEGKDCEININECLSSPCQHGGTCIDGINGFTCSCSRTGYTGSRCDININECENNPCLNNGVCFDNYGGYTCQCAIGFGGQNCEQKLSECASSPCNYPNSLCIESNQSFKCICKPGFTGIPPNCTKTDICSLITCSNGATCRVIGDTYDCICPPGFSGLNCESEADWCVPCANGGVYMKTGDGYFCLCKPGFTGKDCTVALSCHASPCRHATACYDFLGGYYCVCEWGWTGYDCNQEIIDCFSKPCQNDGTCSKSHLGIQFCTCKKGFKGSQCEINVDDCISSPCQNGGTCFDGANGYLCNCTSDFMGNNCELRFDVCAQHPCLNNGTCVPRSDKMEYYCECAPGFEGLHCENNINDCLNKWCPDDKVCVDGINEFECKCANGLSGSDCTTKVPHCSVKPCLNGGSCIESPGNYTCICPPSFSGMHCDLDVDECEITPRICNNGICVNKAGSYQCFCTPGFSGDHCEVEFDECLSHPCKNGATCENKINKFNCICTPGFTGIDCSIDIDECLSNPCVNGSSCINEIATFSCVCPLGLTGRYCETDINDCESSPCKNGGKCVDALNSYTCDCQNTGYEGPHCEQNIDECASNPCTNGADCKDIVKGYVCTCFPGYDGVNCEIDINECLSNPCQFNGTCIEKSDRSRYIVDPNSYPQNSPVFNTTFDYANASGYECLCIKGITGVNCETNINECESSPCIHGTCQDQVAGYTCDCDEGFEGTYCEIDIDECERVPCVNGTCIDRVADYYCECDGNYGGKNCSVELTGCQENKCLNNGTCKPYLENETIHKFNCSCTNGFQGPICEKVTTMSFNGSSYGYVNTTREEGYDIQFKFKTTLGNGLLAIGKGSTFYILELVQGRLNLHSSLLNKWEGVFIGSGLNDSKWQKVFVAINSSHLVLGANEEQTIYPINLNEGTSASFTSFPITFLGGAISYLRKLTHGPPAFVGCIQDVTINGLCVLPQEAGKPISFIGVEVGCKREAQCNPNPCHSGGHCTDLWRNFSCTCERPYLGRTCQYNLTAATFGHENITDSVVNVTVDQAARKAVRSIMDISMFIRTREPSGGIFYLGSKPGSALYTDETVIAAKLLGGELKVSFQFNGNVESYGVDGVRLDNGFNHLIQVVRNITLVQVKINGTEYFRKTISATGQLDLQFLQLGGILGNGTKEVRNFKGVIQDVEMSNGSRVMVVEFFPLTAEDLVIPPKLGQVYLNNSLVLEGVVSDDSCREQPCMHGGTCTVTWNDFSCACTVGHKGKQCQEMEFCQVQDCPPGSECRNLNHGYECVANITIHVPDEKATGLKYRLVHGDQSVGMGDVTFAYRSKTGGNILQVGPDMNGNYLAISVYNDQVTVSWNVKGLEDIKNISKDQRDGDWTTVWLKIFDNTITGGLTGASEDTPQYFTSNFSQSTWETLVASSNITIGGASQSSDIDRHSYITGEGVQSNTVEFVHSGSPINNFGKLEGMYRGCIGEVRFGGLLLPYFTPRELNSTNSSSTDHFELLPESFIGEQLGCLLCFDTECQNGGKCTNSTLAYTCTCLPGFEGDDCSNNIDECKENDCKNNSTCIDGLANYTCKCQPGWQGSLCDIEINECASNPCQNNGSCIDRLAMFECVCPTEFVGLRCEQLKLITCENDPCKNHAECKDVVNPISKDNFTCVCQDGFLGDRCEEAFCSVTPCQNNGICVSNAMIPVCECVPGYTGKLCETNINECESNPCEHGGQCKDDIASFHCQCEGTGFRGTTCNIDINECEEVELCVPNGTCLNTIGSYHCDCLPEFCGKNCTMLDPCLMENRCENGGTCVPKCIDNTDYICLCTHSYTGQNCTEVHQFSGSRVADIALIVVPILAILIIAGLISLSVFLMMARKKRATRGTYSPSSQEYCNPRVELDNVMKPPPEERLI